MQKRQLYLMRATSTQGGIDLSLVRKLNSGTILRVLRSHGRIGRREISELTGLSFPTVCRVVDDLVSKSLIVEAASKNIGVAKRKTTLFDIDPAGGWVMAMEVGGSHIKAAAMDLTAKMFDSFTIPLENVQGEALVAPALRSCVAHLLNKCEPTHGKPLVIGISSAGWVDPALGIVKHSINLQLNNFPIARVVQQIVDVPVVVNDNIVASTLAEARLGHGKQHSDFAYISVGVGVGGGYVLNGQVLNLHSRSQLGLTVLGTEGDPGRFEGRGYLESLASGSGIAASARKALESGASSLLSEFAPEGPAYVTAKMVAEAARQSDKLALDIIAKAMDYLGMAIVNVASILALSQFVINGGVSKSGDTFWVPLRKAVEKYEYWPGEIQLVPSSFDEDAAVIGAGLLALDMAFELVG